MGWACLSSPATSIWHKVKRVSGPTILNPQRWSLALSLVMTATEHNKSPDRVLEEVTGGEAVANGSSSSGADDRTSGFLFWASLLMRKTHSRDQQAHTPRTQTTFNLESI